ncbi:hypothetical protein R1sor_012268 [Riccia sorocarpa]|uniref:Uncharacterized protein n=1 Tax=Riccia sorocarpa TaxID=122646 RepID=A0ABD3I3B0_9MARC
MSKDGPHAGAPLHFELYTEEDEDNYMRWKWISKKEAHRVLRGIDAALLQRSELHDALWLDWSRPEEGLINVVLLGKQKQLEVTGAFLYILKNKVGPANLNEDLDWASYFNEKIREEIRACRKQMMATGKRKFQLTCIGIVILHILRVLGVVDDGQLVHSDSDEGLPEPQQSESPDRHTQSSSPGVIRGDSSSSPASRRSGSPAHAVASSSEASPEPDRRVASA